MPRKANAFRNLEIQLFAMKSFLNNNSLNFHTLNVFHVLSYIQSSHVQNLPKAFIFLVFQFIFY